MCDEIEESTVFLYVFEEGYPIVVTFSLGESDSVIATARHIVNDRFNTADANEIELRLFYRSEFAFFAFMKAKITAFSRQAKRG